MWSDPNFTLASDDQRATVNLAASAGGLDFANSQPLILTNLGFSIPGNVVITALSILVEARASTSTAPTNLVGAVCEVSLVSGGAVVRVLIAYGAYWFPWYMRRLAERPANVWFVLRSMFAG